MSVRFTDESYVAMYDSVSMTAIEGPLFGSVSHAEDFVAWLGEAPRCECPSSVDHAEWARGYGDPRLIPTSTLVNLHSRWSDEVANGRRSP